MALCRRNKNVTRLPKLVIVEPERIVMRIL